MYFLYSAALMLAFVIATPFWLFKMLSHGKYRAGLSERLGRVPDRVRSAQPGDVWIWIHAGSVGEVLAVVQAVNTILRQLEGKIIGNVASVVDSQDVLPSAQLLSSL